MKLHGSPFPRVCKDLAGATPVTWVPPWLPVSGLESAWVAKASMGEQPVGWGALELHKSFQCLARACSLHHHHNVALKQITQFLLCSHEHSKRAKSHGLGWGGN